MSAARRNPSVRQEPQGVPVRYLHGAGLALALLLASGWFFTWVADVGVPVHVGSRREAAVRKEVPREVEMIDQSLFAQERSSTGVRDAKRRELTTWGWVDQPHGIVRMPIERAMDIVAEQGRVR